MSPTMPHFVPFHSTTVKHYSALKTQISAHTLFTFRIAPSQPVSQFQNCEAPGVRPPQPACPAEILLACP
jgi:hypothetical protein